MIVREVDKARYQRQAEREGLSLGAWLREAAEARIAAARPSRWSSRAELEGFFAACAAREDAPEPDWPEHRRVIERSRVDGTEPR